MKSITPSLHSQRLQMHAANRSMRLCVIGGGRVGLPTAALFAELGHNVVCCDKDAGKVAIMRRGKIWFSEPGLEEIVAAHTRSGALTFCTKLTSSHQFDAVFIALPTGSEDDHRQLTECVAKVVASAPAPCIVIKSTVTPAFIEELAAMHPNADIASNPEFLQPGNVMRDFTSPARIVIGANTPATAAALQQVYAPLSSRGVRIIVTSRANAALIKLAANFFLALRVAAINEIACYCEAIEGGDMDSVINALAADPRIGGHYLQPGIGFGGPCLPKDCAMLAQSSHSAGSDITLAATAHQANEHHTKTVVRQLLATCRSADHNGKPTIAVWGGGFKPHSDDMANGRAVTILTELLRYARVHFWDSRISGTAMGILPRSIKRCSGWRDSLKAADILAILMPCSGVRPTDVKTAAPQIIVRDYAAMWTLQDAARAGINYQRLGSPAIYSCRTKKMERASKQHAGVAKKMKP